MALLPYPRSSLDPLRTENDTIELAYELRKSPKSGLGVTITGSNSGYDGLYISDVPHTSAAYGRLRVGDRILRVDGFSLVREGLSDTDALRVIQDRLFDDSLTVRLTVLRSPLLSLHAKPSSAGGKRYCDDGISSPTSSEPEAVDLRGPQHRKKQQQFEARGGPGNRRRLQPTVAKSARGLRTAPSATSSPALLQQRQKQQQQRPRPRQGETAGGRAAQRGGLHPGFGASSGLPSSRSANDVASTTPGVPDIADTEAEPVFASEPQYFGRLPQPPVHVQPLPADGYVAGHGSTLAVEPHTSCRMCTTARTMYGLDFCARHATDPSFLDSMGSGMPRRGHAAWRTLALSGRAYLESRAAAYTQGYGDETWGHLVREEEVARRNMMMHAHQFVDDEEEQEDAVEVEMVASDLAARMAGVGVDDSVHQQQQQQQDTVWGDSGGDDDRGEKGEGEGQTLQLRHQVGSGGEGLRPQAQGDNANANNSGKQADEEEEEEEEAETETEDSVGSGGGVRVTRRSLRGTRHGLSSGERADKASTIRANTTGETEGNGKGIGRSRRHGGSGKRISTVPPPAVASPANAPMEEYEVVGDTAEVAGLREFSGVANVGTGRCAAVGADSIGSARGSGRSHSAGQSSHGSGEQKPAAWARDPIKDPEAATLITFLSEMDEEHGGPQNGGQQQVVGQLLPLRGVHESVIMSSTSVVGSGPLNGPACDAGNAGRGQSTTTLSRFQSSSTTKGHDDSVWHSAEPVFTF